MLCFRLQLHLWCHYTDLWEGERPAHTGPRSFQLDVLTVTADMPARLQVADNHSLVALPLPPCPSRTPPPLCPPFLPLLPAHPSHKSSNALIFLSVNASLLYCPHKYSRVENNELGQALAVLSWGNVTTELRWQLYVPKGSKRGGKCGRSNGQD